MRVSRRAARRDFEEKRRAAFRDRRDYRRFLRTTGLTDRDFRIRTKLDLLRSRLSIHVTRGAVGADEEMAALERFVERFRRKWRARTACATGYATDECGREVGRAQP